MSDLPFLDVVIFTPLAGAVLLGLIPKERDIALRYGALLVTLVTFVLSLGVLWQFEAGATAGGVPFQLGTTAAWIP